MDKKNQNLKCLARQKPSLQQVGETSGFAQNSTFRSAWIKCVSLLEGEMKEVCKGKVSIMMLTVSLLL